MKSYKGLLLAYIDTYRKIDYTLLEEEYHVKARQILTWIEELYQDGYIIEEQNSYSLTQLGLNYKSESWLEFSSCKERENDEKFTWNFLYIPKKLEI